MGKRKVGISRSISSDCEGLSSLRALCYLVSTRLVANFPVDSFEYGGYHEIFIELFPVGHLRSR